MNRKGLYAFYGSLRKGMYNYEYFKKGLKFIETNTVKGFDLYSLGSFPCIVKSTDPAAELTIDLFEADDDTAKRIDRMERGAGYDYEEVDVNGEKFGIYTYDNKYKPSSERLVPGGDWVKYLQLRNVN